jgi:hypothetical protein
VKAITDFRGMAWHSHGSFSRAADAALFFGEPPRARRGLIAPALSSLRDNTSPVICHVDLMLATPAKAIFSAPGWLFLRARAAMRRR